MPRFFFHSRDGVTSADRLGVDFPDAATARREGARYLAELVRDEAGDAVLGDLLEVTVVNEAGGVIGVLRFTSSDGEPEG